MKRRRGSRAAGREPAHKVEPHFAPDDEPGTNAEASVVTEASSSNDPEENRRSVRAFLIAAVEAAFIVPALFYLQFGVIDSFALSFTGFLVVLCLLVALGYSIPDKVARQSAAQQSMTAATQPRLLNRVGSFWLVACAFGPFFGWVVTAPEFPVTEGDWWWRYVVRVVLSVGLPVLTALPLVAYVRGRYWYVALPLLMCVTALPVWSGLSTMLDLREGPSIQRATGIYDAPHNSFFPLAEGKAFLLKTLRHTGRTIKIEPAPDDGRR